MAYPVTYDIERPTHEFDRGQVLLRILLILVLYWLLNGVASLVWLGLPIFAAILISQKGPERYLQEKEGPLQWIRIVMGFLAYAAFLTEKLPLEKPEEVVDLDVKPTGTPSIGQALLRIILSIPHWFVLAILGFVGAFVWFGTVVSILVNGMYPDWGHSYMRGYFRWYARVLTYMASLVDEYPPFSFETGGAPATTPPPAPAV